MNAQHDTRDPYGMAAGSLSPFFRYAIANRLRRAFCLAWVARMRGKGCNIGSGGTDYAPFLGPDASLMNLDVHPGPNVHVVADVQRMNIESKSLDWILCADVLEHVPDTEAAMREMHRCLKPSGALLLTVPQTVPLHGEPHDYWRFTPHGVRALAARHGFRVDHIEPFGDYRTCIWQTRAAEWHRRYGGLERCGGGIRRLPLRLLAATVAPFCAFCYALAFSRRRGSARRAGSVIGWGACLTKDAAARSMAAQRGDEPVGKPAATGLP